MNKQQEALRLALEALEESLGYVEEEAENAQRLYGQYPTRQARIQGLKDDARKHMDAITALREALAEQPAIKQDLTPEQPAQVDPCIDGSCSCCWTHLDEQPAQQQKPVAWMDAEGDVYKTEPPEGWCPPHTPLYTSPQPAQPSKPLTDEMITAGARALCKQMAEGCGVDAGDQWQFYADTFKEDAKAVLEAAHGIKE